MLQQLRRRYDERPVVTVVVGLVVVALVLVAVPATWWWLDGPGRFEALELGSREDVGQPLTGFTDPGEAMPADSGSDQEVASDRDGAPAADADPDDSPDDGDATAAPRPPEVRVPPDAQVWLVMSTGTGQLSQSEADRMRMPRGTQRGGDNLTDVLMLVVVDPATQRTTMLSIPRDTWNFARGHRINATLALHGVQALVDDVVSLTGLPVDHVVGVNMRGFVRLVDAAGGVVVATDRDLRDDVSNLPHLPPGCWLMNGPDALAYVRSRYTMTLRDGAWVVDEDSLDFGRTRRQRDVIGSLWERLRGPRLLTLLPTAARVVGDDLTLDDQTSLVDIADLARAMQDTTARGIDTYLLPTYSRTIRGAAAEIVDGPAAIEVLAEVASVRDPVGAVDPASGREAADGRVAGPTTLAPVDSVRPSTDVMLAAFGGLAAAGPHVDRSLDPATCSPLLPPWRELG